MPTHLYLYRYRRFALFAFRKLLVVPLYARTVENISLTMCRYG